MSMTPTFICKVQNDLRGLTDAQLNTACNQADVNTGRFCGAGTKDETFWDMLRSQLYAERIRRTCKQLLQVRS